MSERTTRNERICIAAPCFNEEEVLQTFCDQLRATVATIPDVDFTILLIDDGSTDRTLAIANAIAAQDPRVRVYSFSRNFGHQLALSAAIAQARGDAVILMDADLQHPPALIPTFIARWRDGADIVCGVRQHTEDASLLKRWSSAGFYALFNVFSDVRITPGGADFCLLSRRVRRVIADMPERHRFLRGMVAWAGYPRCEIPYTASARAAGRSKYDLLRMVGLAADAVFSFSTRPLRLATKLGMLIALLGWVYLIYILYVRIFCHGAVQGWASILSVLVILGGVQLVFIGLQGEYIARSLEQAKGRPHYLFKQIPPRTRSRPQAIHAG